MIYLDRPDLTAAQELADQVYRLAKQDERPDRIMWGYFLRGLSRLYRGELTRASDDLVQARSRYHAERDHPRVTGSYLGNF
jgi:hypothetical protein